MSAEAGVTPPLIVALHRNALLRRARLHPGFRWLTSFTRDRSRSPRRTADAGGSCVASGSGPACQCARGHPAKLAVDAGGPAGPLSCSGEAARSHGELGRSAQSGTTHTRAARRGQRETRQAPSRGSQTTAAADYVVGIRRIIASSCALTRTTTASGGFAVVRMEPHSVQERAERE
jgi:hypothetical protein